jgi:hypothetical protein
MISGLRPVTPLATMRASGVMPSCLAFVSLITTTAAAPSLSGQALPAVTSPSGRNAGLSCARPSSVVPARGQSSLSTTVPSGNVRGVMSRSKKPLASAFWAFSCELSANASICSRVVPVCSATFSAVWPIAM